MEKDINLNYWLNVNIIPNILKNFNEKYEVVNCKISLPENSFYLSRVIFVNLKLENINNKNDNRIIDIVIKSPSEFLETNEFIPMNALFHNEILFYNEILNNDLNFPKCYYAFEDNNDYKNDIIVLENIETKGFNLCPVKSYIPLNYLMCSIETIAKFHGFGYTLKEKKPEKFQSIIEKIMESRYEPESSMKDFINNVSTRPTEYLKKHNYDTNFTSKMEQLLKNAFNDIMINCVKPEEPLAVLCHGDFTRNNIFFKNDHDKLDGMLIDFAMMRYSSPMIDLTTFFYISVSTKDREEKFNDLFQLYHSTLIDSLQENNIQNLERFSYEKMLSDYKKKALFGYIIAIFFLPIVKGVQEFSPQDLLNFEPIKQAEMCKSAGGDELSKEFADMLLHLKNTGCLDHI